MLAHLCAAALLLMAGSAGAQYINVTVNDVLVTLTDSQSSQGERYTLGKMHYLTITCLANSTLALTSGNFFWRKANANVSITQDPRTSVQTEITNGGLSGKSVLTINYPVKSDITSYTCAVNQTSTATGSFQSAPLLTLLVNGINEYDAALWPADSVTIVCQVDGNPVGDIRWSKSVDPSFNVTNNSAIYLNSVKYEADRGYITCASRNKNGGNSATLFLRVKSPLSFLAPLIAIICEVVFMVVVIIAFEIINKKRRRVRDDPKSE